MINSYLSFQIKQLIEFLYRYVEAYNEDLDEDINIKDIVERLNQINFDAKSYNAYDNNNSYYKILKELMDTYASGKVTSKYQIKNGKNKVEEAQQELDTLYEYIIGVEEYTAKERISINSRESQLNFATENIEAVALLREEIEEDKQYLDLFDELINIARELYNTIQNEIYFYENKLVDYENTLGRQWHNAYEKDIKAQENLKKIRDSIDSVSNGIDSVTSPILALLNFVTPYLEALYAEYPILAPSINALDNIIKSYIDLWGKQGFHYMLQWSTTKENVNGLDWHIISEDTQGEKTSWDSLNTRWKFGDKDGNKAKAKFKFNGESFNSRTDFNQKYSNVSIQTEVPNEMFSVNDSLGSLYNNFRKACNEEDAPEYSKYASVGGIAGIAIVPDPFQLANVITQLGNLFNLENPFVFEDFLDLEAFLIPFSPKTSSPTVNVSWVSLAGGNFARLIRSSNEPNTRDKHVFFDNTDRTSGEMGEILGEALNDVFDNWGDNRSDIITGDGSVIIENYVDSAYDEQTNPQGIKSYYLLNDTLEDKQSNRKPITYTYTVELYQIKVSDFNELELQDMAEHEISKVEYFKKYRMKRLAASPSRSVTMTGTDFLTDMFETGEWKDRFSLLNNKWRGVTLYDLIPVLKDLIKELLQFTTIMKNLYVKTDNILIKTKNAIEKYVQGIVSMINNIKNVIQRFLDQLAANLEIFYWKYIPCERGGFNYFANEIENREGLPEVDGKSGLVAFYLVWGVVAADSFRTGDFSENWAEVHADWREDFIYPEFGKSSSDKWGPAMESRITKEQKILRRERNNIKIMIKAGTKTDEDLKKVQDKLDKLDALLKDLESIEETNDNAEVEEANRQIKTFYSTFIGNEG